ncbi:unnamed protein product [Vitrella brassicaformis CCMP3155]|uniref:Uncharacterized protein n=1 Tax=Vitrella brassicaformis (strain CCMP3155) TaxID=1169540 RepID=A0A0G4E9A5_VITBC|nr:unnamed protein product [Vitrella brassicaformis CCMP3155]|eukprot:CEL91817.1 unnamed protein product [Vitrella brassicaformis CCMP3155]
MLRCSSVPLSRVECGLLLISFGRVHGGAELFAIQPCKAATVDTHRLLVGKRWVCMRRSVWAMPPRRRTSPAPPLTHQSSTSTTADCSGSPSHTRTVGSTSTRGGEDRIKAEVFHRGPVVIAINAPKFLSESIGCVRLAVFDWLCSTGRRVWPRTAATTACVTSTRRDGTDHAVVVVGWNETTPAARQDTNRSSCHNCMARTLESGRVYCVCLSAIRPDRLDHPEFVGPSVGRLSTEVQSAAHFVTIGPRGQMDHV